MNVAIYARVSTGDQETDNQLIQLREFCERSAWTVAGEYIDKASAATGERPEFKRMFSDAHQRRFDLVLFWSLDRFSREGSRETLNYLQELESYGVGFKSFTEQYFDSAGMFKDAIIAIMATLAKQERVRLSERVKAGLERAKANGQQLGRKPISEDKRADILRLRAKGQTVRQIKAETGVALATISKVINS